MATSETTISVICDTGPILHLDELGSLDVLSDFQHVIVTESIASEIIRHRPNALQHPGISFQHVSVPPISDLEFLTLCRIFALHSGEIEALALMESFSDAIFLTDDSAARLVGKKMGYKVHGTLGILLRSIRRQLKTPQDVIMILKMLPQKSTLHIKASLVQDIIRQIQEEYHL